MRHVVTLAVSFVATAGLAAEKAQNPWDPNYVVSEETARAIEGAVPNKPLVAPARGRKLLIYGRVPTHPESVACCFKAIDALGKRTGAFQAVASGDPLVFLPDHLKHFDAVLMNNTHEGHPMLPRSYEKLGATEQAAARNREELLKKSLIEFVSDGKGLVGIHAATIAGIWPEYQELIGGKYAGHITQRVTIRLEDAQHPLCAALGRNPLEINDEIYLFQPPYSRQKVRVLLSLDLAKTPDPGKRKDGDYAVSWVRPYGKGRVFYCSLGHAASTYHNPHVLRHYLAGIQFALGDLKADAAPR